MCRWETALFIACFLSPAVVVYGGGGGGAQERSRKDCKQENQQEPLTQAEIVGGTLLLTGVTSVLLGGLIGCFLWGLAGILVLVVLLVVCCC